VIGLRSIGLSNALWVTLAVLGGLGVAGKEIITDFLGYFVILIQRPIKIGDMIKLDADLNGIVRSITWRSTLVRKNNSVSLIIPNSLILSRPVMNWNYARSYIAFDDILFSVGYETDPQVVKQLIHQLLDRNTHILKNPAAVVRLHDFNENGFQFLIRGFVSSNKVQEQSDIISDIRLELVKALREQGIEIGAPRILRIVNDREMHLQ
jgi:small-conductance mechanosensitive channel